MNSDNRIRIWVRAQVSPAPASRTCLCETLAACKASLWLAWKFPDVLQRHSRVNQNIYQHLFLSWSITSIHGEKPLDCVSLLWLPPGPRCSMLRMMSPMLSEEVPLKLETLEVPGAFCAAVRRLTLFPLWAPCYPLVPKQHSWCTDIWPFSLWKQLLNFCM